MNLQCPMPKFNFDSINLGHGSGGVLSQQLLNSGVFTILQNELLDTRHDGAIFNLTGRVAFSTDSYVVSPIFFPGGNIGELAVNGTVNDLSMCGAMPKYLSLAFIIEEGLPMTEFWTILHSIRMACDRAGVQIITGDTKVVEKGKGDKIFINTSGIGLVHPQANIQLSSIKTGDKILLNGSIANHGIAIMSQRNGLEFETDIVSDTQPLNHLVRNLMNRFGSDIHFLRDATRGGLASVLNEIAKDASTGIEIKQSSIVITEQVNGACEMLGLDPLYVANEGIFLAIVDAAIADQVLATMQADEMGKEACIIGEVVADHAGQVILQSSIGGRRVVNMLPGEQLPRIC
ncbi:MAG: hydrogenase expression/formation protein HypE [Bacteroidota bacterium]